MHSLMVAPFRELRKPCWKGGGKGETREERPEQNRRMTPDQKLQIQNENAVRVVSQKRATTTAEETSRKACAKTPSRTERAGRGSKEKRTGDGRASLLVYPLSLSLSLSLSLGLPHRRSRSVFF